MDNIAGSSTINTMNIYQFGVSLAIRCTNLESVWRVLIGSSILLLWSRIDYLFCVWLAAGCRSTGCAASRRMGGQGHPRVYTGISGYNTTHSSSNLWTIHPNILHSEKSIYNHIYYFTPAFGTNFGKLEFVYVIVRTHLFYLFWCWASQHLYYLC